MSFFAKHSCLNFFGLRDDKCLHSTKSFVISYSICFVLMSKYKIQFSYLKQCDKTTHDLYFGNAVKIYESQKDIFACVSLLISSPYILCTIFQLKRHKSQIMKRKHQRHGEETVYSIYFGQYLRSTHCDQQWPTLMFFIMNVRSPFSK